eukprot:TRINITY_DN624_c0_g1_i2.p1 TRINITY_DN624_c0_g1~~TRINITY_DN624_c0_g1_i2.p1  ORF type:complete len:223 (-),score=52.33 TRINITY_DN624_c0_g1_i2:555-1223(-)
MSEIFAGYERQYVELSSTLARKSANTAMLSGEQKRQKLQELKGGLEEADSLIRMMELEARSLPASQKALLLAKLREYKGDLTKLKREATKTTGVTERDELLELGGAKGGVDVAVAGDQRSRLLTNTARLDDSTDRLREGRRALLETEDLGVSILEELHKQRESLINTRTTLHGMDDNIGRSKAILNAMGRRMSRHKWITGGIIGVLVLAIALVVFFKFRSKS